MYACIVAYCEHPAQCSIWTTLVKSGTVYMRFHCTCLVHIGGCCLPLLVCNMHIHTHTTPIPSHSLHSHTQTHTLTPMYTHTPSPCPHPSHLNYPVLIWSAYVPSIGPPSHRVGNHWQWGPSVSSPKGGETNRRTYIHEKWTRTPVNTQRYSPLHCGQHVHSFTHTKHNSDTL